MVILDLRLILFVLIALLATLVSGAVWLDRVASRRRWRWVLGRTLDDAPFGVLRLAPEGQVQYANPAAQRLLDLPARGSPWPKEEWVDHLLADEEAVGSRYRLVALPRDRWLRAWISEDGALVFLFDATEQQRAV
ncbi:MAG: PAS domain-containing protein, partial [Caldilineales bacterium]|nr:PAS domain-containing protein [Caldilineales bacterium]